MSSKKNLIKQILLVFGMMTGAIALLTLTSGIAEAAGTFIDPNDNVVAGVTGGEGSLRVLVIKMINYFLGFLGIVAVIMVIYGGVTYITAAGNDEGLGNAKKIIMYALVGIIIILLSFAVVNTIIGAGLGVEQ